MSGQNIVPAVVEREWPQWETQQARRRAAVSAPLLEQVGTAHYIFAETPVRATVTRVFGRKAGSALVGGRACWPCRAVCRASLVVRRDPWRFGGAANLLVVYESVME